MTRNVDKSSYAVGRGKPPVHTRFRPGQSGNPRGRPKGAKNLDTIMDEALGERVVVMENGRRRSLTKMELISRQLVNKAAAGDLKSVALTLKYQAARQSASDTHVAESVFGGKDDEQFLSDLLEQLAASPRQAGDPK